MERPIPAESLAFDLPLNLGLNDGTYCPKACIEVLQGMSSTTDLRNYTSSDNAPLLEVIARIDGVRPDHIYLANGSGPLLKQCVPALVEKGIRASPLRIARHLLSKNGYPLITPELTYFKVPLKGARLGLQIELLPLTPESGFKLDPAHIRAALKKRPGLVYITNPNNPTGDVLISREDLVPLLEEFREATFWLDEAYIQYIDPEEHAPLSDLVPHHPNLVVSRTFSFAYGLAGVRMGYLLARPEWIQEFASKVTDYSFGTLQESLAIAALEDAEHLPFMRRQTREQLAILLAGVRSHEGIEAFDSKSNFFLARFTDGQRTGPVLAEKLAERGIKIKVFAPVKDRTYEAWFRVTLGLPDENRFFLDQLAGALHDLA
jgi:histidinol-phosphate aminotransferase